MERARAAKAQAEADEAARVARAKAAEAERQAAIAREQARAAEKAREEAELKAKREKLEQLKKLKEAKDRQEKAKAKQTASVKQQAAAKTTKATVDKIVEREVDNSKMDYYSSLDIQSLFAEVKKFAQQRGLSRQIIDRKLLEDNFGKANINRLILKSYLISINKGVTFGYG